MVPASDHAAPIPSGTCRQLNGTPGDLARDRGTVALVANTASRCGFTGQYGPLQSVSRSRQEEGLVVPGFPSNDANREPSTNGPVAAVHGVADVPSPQRCGAPLGGRYAASGVTAAAP